MTERKVIMRFFKFVAIILLLGTLGCGMSEGQNAVLYLGSVTVQERRMETEARTIEKLAKEGQRGNFDRNAMLSAVKHAKITAQAGQEELNKLTVPESTKDIHELYKQMFELAIKQLDTTEKVLTSTNVSEAQKLQSELATLQPQIADLEAKILAEKRKLSEKYQEVQLPEASPSTNGSK